VPRQISGQSRRGTRGVNVIVIVIVIAPLIVATLVNRNDTVDV
jgi:hypothetical protein